MDDLLTEFLTETAESIDEVDAEVVKLEQDPNNRNVIDNIFRLVHTIKGTCGFLGLPRLEAVAHASENVLGKFRDGALDVTPAYVTVILQSLDQIKAILAVLEAEGEEPAGDDSELINALDAIAMGEADGSDVTPAPETNVPEEPEATDSPDTEIDPSLGRALKPGEVSLEELEAAFASAPGPEENDAETSVIANTEAPLIASVGGGAIVQEIVSSAHTLLLEDEAIKTSFAGPSPDSWKPIVYTFYHAVFADDDREISGNLIALEKLDGLTADVLKAITSALTKASKALEIDSDVIGELEMIVDSHLGELAESLKSKSSSKKTPDTRPESTPTTAPAAPGKQVRPAQTIRVGVDLLEDLMTLVSELVLTRNQLLQMVRRLDESEFSLPLQRLSQCTTELQEGVMKTRMQPIGSAWSKLPRLVRDLTNDLGKKIELVMLGEDTELDRQVLELVKDPLTHMVRNSADHGIEMPEVRRKSGKAETGKIRLNAFHEGGHIIVEISDDGAGINAERIAKKVLDVGLATRSELEQMSENQIQKYIFHPGLSTAEEITSVSGRGVGMDVVRTNIEKIGGTIDLVSTPGKGTTFQIKIPLTLAIVSALIVESAGERYAIPQISVLELVKASDGSDYTVEHINNTPVLRLRNRLLPLIHLRDVLGFPVEEGSEQDAFIVVTQVGNFSFGIMVDQVFDTEEIVVKPLASILQDLSVFSGNTILGDGSVIMILDPNGIANAVTTSVQESDQTERLEVASLSQDNDIETMLVFSAGAGGPKAVPLSLVARLEELDSDSFETSGGRSMVQYRDSLMPLVRLDGDTKTEFAPSQPIIVFVDGENSVGLCVDEILDIVDEALEVELNTSKTGVVGSAVIAGKVAEIIDVCHYQRSAFPPNQAHQPKSSDFKNAKRILIVDDSAFFRNLLKPQLQAVGYDVKTSSRVDQALALLAEGEIFDLIISDIEMPGMNGFDFAEKLRAEPSYSDVPVIAVSSLSEPRKLDAERQDCFNDYVAKFDREMLLEVMNRYLDNQRNAA
ncbi:MAG: chemotaxis protein CheW [Pseudomonadota bacterium]